MKDLFKETNRIVPGLNRIQYDPEASMYQFVGNRKKGYKRRGIYLSRSVYDQARSSIVFLCKPAEGGGHYAAKGLFFLGTIFNTPTFVDDTLASGVFYINCK